MFFALFVINPLFKQVTGAYEGEDKCVADDNLVLLLLSAARDLT
jgi:hypothetical protein